jgi:hypothetical protein
VQISRLQASRDFDLKALAIDGSVIQKDLTRVLKIIVLEHFRRVHHGLFHHTAQQKELVFYFLDFLMKGIARHHYFPTNISR